MMIPKIKFVYSGIYDWKYRDSIFIKEYLKKTGENYPSFKIITQYISSVGKLWGKQENKILQEISKITNLKWQEKEIKCYVIGQGRSFSDPLTLRIYKNKNDFIDTLTHELIHQIFIQNSPKTLNYWRYLRKNYSNESRITQNHIPLHAIHKKLYLNLFNKKRLTNDINKCQEFEDYKRAWQIVEKEGHENIIKEFRKRIKS